VTKINRLGIISHVHAYFIGNVQNYGFKAITPQIVSLTLLKEVIVWHMKFELYSNFRFFVILNFSYNAVSMVPPSFKFMSPQTTQTKMRRRLPYIRGFLRVSQILWKFLKTLFYFIRIVLCLIVQVKSKKDIAHILCKFYANSIVCDLIILAKTVKIVLSRKLAVVQYSKINSIKTYDFPQLFQDEL
jgi:hypothetical protein